MSYKEINAAVARELLPRRPKDANKGTFGRAFAYIGSEKYYGACHLATEAMLRGGAGYVELAGEPELVDSVLAKFPEVIFDKLPPTKAQLPEHTELIIERSRQAAVTLVGCGSGASEALARLTERLILLECCSPLIIDADAINSLSRYTENADAIMSSAKRPIILTPHEMEFSRISGRDIDEISRHRVEYAEDFARKFGATVVLKGLGTVVTDGEKTYLNTSGSSALAKAGSGDTLAGLMSSLIATRLSPPLELAALACYIHGKAGDNLSESLSSFGVTPSDLPKEMAKVLRELELGT